VAYFGGDLKAAPSAVRAQSFADGRHFGGNDFRVAPHEPETPGVKLPKRLLRQGEFLRREIRRGCFGPLHGY